MRPDGRERSGASHQLTPQRTDIIDDAVREVLGGSAGGMEADAIAPLLSPELCPRTTRLAEQLRVEAGRALTRLGESGDVRVTSGGRQKRYQLTDHGRSKLMSRDVAQVDVAGSRPTTAE